MYHTLRVFVREWAAIAAASLLSGCADTPLKPITTYEGHCKAVLSPPDPNALFSRERHFAPDSIRDSFVKWYDSLVTQDAAENYLAASASDTVVRELHRLRMVGVWRDGTALHFANTLLHGPDEGYPVTMTFDGLVQGFRERTDLRVQDTLASFQRCLFSAMNAYFTELTVEGLGTADTVTIPLAYYMKSHEKYNDSAANWKQ